MGGMISMVAGDMPHWHLTHCGLVMGYGDRDSPKILVHMCGQKAGAVKITKNGGGKILGCLEMGPVNALEVNTAFDTAPWHLATIIWWRAWKKMGVVKSWEKKYGGSKIQKKWVQSCYH